MQVVEQQFINIDSLLSYKTRTKSCKLGSLIHHMYCGTQVLGFNVKDKLLFAIDAKSDSCGEEILDMEFLIPVSVGFQSNENYIFKPKFKLENAVKIRHFGSLATLERSRVQLQQHLLDKELHPITNYYYLVVKTAQEQSEDNIIDIYVGVNGNIV